MGAANMTTHDHVPRDVIRRARIMAWPL